MTKSKDQNKAPETSPKETPDKNFKITIWKMLDELKYR